MAIEFNTNDGCGVYNSMQYCLNFGISYALLLIHIYHGLLKEMKLTTKLYHIYVPLCITNTY